MTVFFNLTSNGKEVYHVIGTFAASYRIRIQILPTFLLAVLVSILFQRLGLASL